MESFHDSADSLDDDDPIAVGQPPRGQIHSVPMRDATDVKDSRSRPDVDDKQYLETTQDCHHELLPSYLPVGGSGDSVDVSPEEKLSSLESSPRKVEGMEARLACINSSDEEELVVGHKRNGDVSPMKEWNKTNNNIEQTGVKRNAATETSTICSDETVEHGHPVQCSAGYPDNVSDCAASLDNYNSLPHKPNLKESREHPVDLTMNVGSETGNKDRTILPNESERCKDTINTAVPVSSRKSSLRSRRGQRDRAVVDDSGSVEKKVGDTFSLSFADGENVEAPTTKVTRSNSLQLIQDFSQNEEQDASKQGEKSPKLVGNSEASEETNKGPDSPSHNGKPSIGQPMRGGSENLRLEQSGAESPLLQCPSLTHSHPIDCKQEGLSAGSESESNAVSQQREKAAGKRGRKGNRQPKRKENTAALAASPDVACSTSPDAGSGKDRVQQDQRDCQIAHSTGCDGGLAKKVKRKMRPYTRRRKRKCSVKTKVEARAKEEEEEEEDEDEDHWPLAKPTGFPSEATLDSAVAASPEVACSTSPDAGSGKDQVQRDQRDCQIAHSTGCNGGLARKKKRKMQPYTRRRKRKRSVKTKVEARAKEEEEEKEDEDEGHGPCSTEPTGFPSEATLGNASPALNTRFSSCCDDDDDDEELVDPVLTPNSKTRDLLPDIALEDVVWALNPGDQRYWPAVVTMIPDRDSKIQMYQVVRTTDDMLQDEGFPCRARNVRLYNCREKAKFKEQGEKDVEFRKAVELADDFLLKLGLGKVSSHKDFFQQKYAFLDSPPNSPTSPALIVGHCTPELLTTSQDNARTHGADTGEIEGEEEEEEEEEEEMRDGSWVEQELDSPTSASREKMKKKWARREDLIIKHIKSEKTKERVLKISRGDVRSERHQLYISNKPKERAQLKLSSLGALHTDEKLNKLMDYLMEILKDSKFGSNRFYLMDVAFPEALNFAYTRLKHVSKEKADEIIHQDGRQVVGDLGVNV